MFIGRQVEVIDNGGAVDQETLRWDEVSGKTFSMRDKELVPSFSDPIGRIDVLTSALKDPSSILQSDTSTYSSIDFICSKSWTCYTLYNIKR